MGLTEKQAISAAWKKGYLRWLCDDNQKGLYDQIKADISPTFYLNLSRRVGKSFLLSVLAIEAALQKPDAQVKYAAATGKAVKRIIRPIFKRILRTCPAELQPQFNSVDGEYKFPNGSVVAIAGCDGENYESLRGTDSDLNIVDEAGFIDNLEYIVDDVLSPMTLETGGRAIISSTPAVTPGHESVKIARLCKERGAYAHRTIWDNPRMSDARKNAYLRQKAEEKGFSLEEFKETTTYKREYMAQFVVDTDRAVIPEWNEKKAKDIVKDWVTPPYFDAYSSLDIGFRDGSGVLFAYWDYVNAKLVIQDELLLFKANTETLATEIKLREHKLWKLTDGRPKQPYLRISDNDLNIIADLQQLHGLTFIATAKDDKERQVNELRVMVRNDKIVIHPRCKLLIRQFEETVWNANRTTYERNADGHGDLLDALVYLVRNLRRHNDPYPQESSPDQRDIFITRDKVKISTAGATILSLFRKIS